MDTVIYRRIWLIQALLRERGEDMEIPHNEIEQKRLLRALFNVRPPRPADPEFLRVQDAYLQEEIRHKGITDYKNLQPVEDGIYLWQGDITTLQCGAIVNAANAQMLGCFCPNHGCIDNAIHTFAGVQLRWECAQTTGIPRLTSAYNLPCKHVLHTVGPIIFEEVTEKDKQALADCYRSCLELSRENNIKSVAFCCISTGEYRFPNQLAAEIAVKTVQEYKGDTEVIFNVFKDSDYAIYRGLLGRNWAFESGTRPGRCHSDWRGGRAFHLGGV